jgi:hypothetical protein
VLHPRGEGASLAVVPRRVVFLQEPDGKPLGAGYSIYFLRCETRAYCESANIRQVLLKFIFSSAFHLSPKQKAMCVPLQLLPLSEIRNLSCVDSESGKWECLVCGLGVAQEVCIFLRKESHSHSDFFLVFPYYSYYSLQDGNKLVRLFRVFCIGYLRAKSWRTNLSLCTSRPSPQGNSPTRLSSDGIQKILYGVKSSKAQCNLGTRQETLICGDSEAMTN